jgi:hypothetical protein
MAQELINIGVTADDGTGDTIRGAGIKINNNFTEVYAQPNFSLSQLSFDGNVISATQSNADIELAGNGTGTVQISDLTIDSAINISDNDIKVNDSNADLLLTANGSGSVLISSADMNEGTIDNTVIGGTTTAAATFTTLTTSGTATVDGVVISDNTITSTSNANLELSGEGTGTVSFNGIKFPTSDGLANQVLQTDGNGQLSYFTSPILFDNTDLTDGTATITGDSSTQTIDSFDASTFRSAKYHIQISDTTADRYKLVEANVVHDGSNAYISITGGASNGAGDGSSIYDSLDISADVSGGNVRLRGVVNNTNTQVVKFVRRIVKV